MVRRSSKSRSRRKFKFPRTYQLEIEAGISREIVTVLYLLVVVIIFLSWRGAAGVVGEKIRAIMLLLVGEKGVYLLMGICSGLAIITLLWRKISWNFTRFFGLLLFFLSILALWQIPTVLEESSVNNMANLGGYFGFVPAVILGMLLGPFASAVVLVGAALISILIIFEITIREMVEWLIDLFRSRPQRTLAELDEVVERSVRPVFSKARVPEESAPVHSTKAAKPAKPKELTINAPKPIATKTVDFVPRMYKGDFSKWEYPSLELLEDNLESLVLDNDVLKNKASIIRDKLHQFSIPVTMVDVNVGPSVVQFTLEPHEGVKLSRITNLKDDLALALSANAIRIESPIPGKGLVGIEVPNEKRITVRLKEILQSKEFSKLKSPMRLPLGRMVNGEPLVVDLAKMPHLLIAGQTGSGKSVAVNAFLLSLLYQNSPRDLRLILVDPKRVELTKYSNLPHLLTKVITSPDKAMNALKWAVMEMEDRYQEAAHKGARDITEYNELVDPEKRMYKIVIVVDELADLMMSGNRKEVELLINRIAQKARAVGIHLVLATQRPSVDVVTGLIKSNIPARIAFKVRSQIDSRTILDAKGAEDLLGNGDMLYLDGNSSDPIRVQGAFVSTKEIDAVTSKIRLTITDEDLGYNEAILNPPTNATGAVGLDMGEEDDMLPAAIEEIKRTGKASASHLQRALRLGYARAARIIDILEEKGLIGPANGAKPREVYLERTEDEATTEGVEDEI